MDRSKKKPLKILSRSGSFPPMNCGVGSSIPFRSIPSGRRDDLRLAVLTDGSFEAAPIPDIGANAVDGAP